MYITEVITIKGENSHYFLFAIVAIVAVVGLVTILKPSNVQPSVLVLPAEDSIYFEEIEDVFGDEGFTGDIVRSNGTSSGRRYYRRG